MRDGNVFIQQSREIILFRIYSGNYRLECICHDENELQVHSIITINDVRNVNTDTKRQDTFLCVENNEVCFRA